MTVLVGTMQLPVPQDADQVRAYLNGTIADGGLWTGLSRASDHDHTGGLNGKPISVASIPDGSITTGKLDPSVLLPYALVDGSKPFTGQVALNGDAIVRNTLYFGAKPNGVADVTIARTGAGSLRVDTNLGVGVAPAAWDAQHVALQVGAVGGLMSDVVGAATTTTYLMSNVYYNGGWKNLKAQPGQMLQLDQNGSFTFYTAPSPGAAGSTFAWTARAALAQTGALTLSPDAGAPALDAGGYAIIRAAAGNAPLQWTVGGTAKGNIGPQGTLTLTPDAGQNSLVWGSGAGTLSASGVTAFVQSVGGGMLLLGGASAVAPATDNANYLGWGDRRWVSVHLINAPIVSSSVELKENITPLDPAACVASVLGTDWVNYTYKAPSFIAPEPLPELAYDEHDDNETKAAKKAQRDATEDEARKAHARMMVETAPHRRQKGYVLNSPDHQVGAEFGLPDRKTRSDGADLAVVACALQDALRRLAALEGARA